MTIIDVSRLEQVPDDLEPTMNNVWSVFRFLTENATVDEREKLWFTLVAETAAKDQIDFTPEECTALLNRIKAQR